LEGKTTRLVRGVLLGGALILASLSPAPVQAATSAFGGYWWGLNGWEYTIDSEQFFGLAHFRVWTATGQDDCPPCWQDSFVRLDNSIGTAEFSLLLGAQVFSRQSGNLSESHAGPYAGARGEYSLSPSLRVAWEATLSPYNLSSTQVGAGLGETGYSWSLALLESLSPSVNLSVGYYQFFFWLPSQSGGGTRSWEGPDLGLTIRF